MRWEHLFADLEAQAHALEQRERAAEVAERARIEVAGLDWSDRLRAGVGAEVALRCAGTVEVRGELRRLGPGWALLSTGGGAEALVALAHVLSVRGLGRLSAGPGGIVGSTLGVNHVLRSIAADRASCQATLTDASQLGGTLDRVGKDFLEIAVHAAPVRRRSEVRAIVLVPTRALVALYRRGW